MLDKRSNAILQHIVNAASYVPTEEIAEKLNISKRSLYYDIKRINGWLKYHKLTGIRHIQSAGLYLEENTKRELPKLFQQVNPWQYEYSAKERKAWLAIHILTRSRNVSLQDLIDAIRVSRNTAMNDLKGLREEVTRRFQLNTAYSKRTGYIMAGSETDRRKALNVYMSQVIEGKGWQYFIDRMAQVERSDEGEVSLFSQQNLAEIKKAIVSCEDRLGVQFTDEVLQQFNLQIILFLRRLQLGGRVRIAPAEQMMLRRTREHRAAEEICARLTEVFQSEIPSEEVDYLTTYVLSAKVNYINVDLFQEEIPHWRDIIRRMIDDFQRYACVQFYDWAGLENSLLMHLKPAYYRIKYGLCLENPLKEPICKKYGDIFLLTKKVIHYLEESAGQPVNDDEAAYVAMHFGAWMRREGIRPAARKKVLLVCANGVGTSSILQSQLEGLFSNVDILRTVSVREFLQYEEEADFIVSTLPLSGSKKPVFVVSPILSDTETENLLKKVNALFRLPQKQAVSVNGLLEIIGRHAVIREPDQLMQELKEYLYKPDLRPQGDTRPMLSDLITKDKIQMLDKVKDWEDAIATAARPLLQCGYIKEAYIKAMIDNIKKLGPYVVMSPRVAIPHARPDDGVNQVSMSLLILKEGVAFSAAGEERVQILIILAAIDNETHLKALAQLSGLLMEEENVDKLVQAADVGEIVDLIARYSN
ncbi:phosphotransferase system eiib component type 2/3 [Lucifera butyrica]|uniref:Phosphotransferase system eiib component type 2/3 n=1 Tax=Lucifera butyrica TaxID=1351585 RepID=A0A498R3I6_9FIRM|nr:BglG family transcription antiterminator [Lucifera butyrica]VBB05725.1 phosphotransferase system eiib component type 2/3 [Lucifera butyrica]